ncbi:MAG: hypothetical protein WCI18_17375, partial [Pseudomonadota bacterium]
SAVGRSIISKRALISLPTIFSQDVALNEAFERIAKTSGKKRAIVTIARKIIGRIRACFRTGKTYAVGTYA